MSSRICNIRGLSLLFAEHQCSTSIDSVSSKVAIDTPKILERIQTARIVFHAALEVGLRVGRGEDFASAHVSGDRMDLENLLLRNRHEIRRHDHEICQLP